MQAEHDLVIVGGGAAGTTAAIEAADTGLSVLVLEAAREVGGAAAMSGGGCCIPGTPLQASLGIHDDPDLALRDWLVWGGETVDAAWAQLYLSRAYTDVYAWCEARGVKWQALHEEEGNTVPRWHLAQGGGGGLMAALHETARQLPIEWRLSTRVTRLMQHDGTVIGVEADSGDGPAGVRARAVLVATGGFTGNPDMVRRFAPDPGPDSRLLCGGAPSALGLGHMLLQEVGAEFTEMDSVALYPFSTPDDLDPSGVRALGVAGIPNAIWVNAQGRRFHDEKRARSGIQSLMAQRPATCWAIFDRREADGLRLVDPKYRGRDGIPLRKDIEAFLTRTPYVHTADTMADLAQAVGLPTDMFVATLERYNLWIRMGLSVDPDHGRALSGLAAIERPPFFALQFFPMARKNFGGVHTDLSCRVVRPDGSVVPGLYAAGEVAGMAGGHINGRAALEGTMLGPSLFSGRVAARVAASDFDPTRRVA